MTGRVLSSDTAMLESKHKYKTFPSKIIQQKYNFCGDSHAVRIDNAYIYYEQFM